MVIPVTPYRLDQFVITIHFKELRLSRGNLMCSHSMNMSGTNKLVMDILNFQLPTTIIIGKCFLLLPPDQLEETENLLLAGFSHDQVNRSRFIITVH